MIRLTYMNEEYFGSLRQRPVSRRSARRAEALASLGVRSAAYARSTGTLVLVVNGAEHGVDTDDGNTPWSTICDDHGGICSHDTLALARDWASAPEDWCPTCQDERDARLEDAAG